jgi:tyrosyl-tRNA synthetase
VKAFPPLNEQMDAIRRGVVEIIPEEALERKIARAIATGQPLVVKQGFDPTRPDLHLGHIASIRKLRAFQDLGHRVVFLIGDFTALVGDPSGQSETRPRLSEAEVQRNAATYREQIFTVLDPEATVIERNSRWHAEMKLWAGDVAGGAGTDVLTLTSQYTVARMLERDDFEQRYRSGAPISIVEFLYPLLQAYDSVALRADVEVGGTDQKFNLLVGRTLMERYGLEPQVAVIVPLLRGTDGERKMSKSYDNYVGITEAPQEQFGKTMSIPDTLLEEWWTLVSSVGVAQLAAALARCRREPYLAKRALARDLVTQFHGPAAAERAEAHFDRLFRDKGVPEERPTLRHAPGRLAAVLKGVGLAPSSSEARRMIEQGGVQVDGRKVTDPNAELGVGRFTVRYGKLKFADVEIADR